MDIDMWAMAMNNEIKEILENCEKAINEASGYNNTTNKIIDYITNLQKKIHKQIHTSIVQKKQINNLQKRNSRQRLANQKQQELILKLQEDKKKAVEYIKEHIRIDDEYPAYMEMLIEERDDLLNILQNGSDASVKE